jgi:hypothetical protein
MSSAEVGQYCGKSESGMRSTALTSTHLEPVGFFKGCLLRTMKGQRPRVYTLLLGQWKGIWRGHKFWLIIPRGKFTLSIEREGYITVEAVL